jgi:N-acetylglucosamine kinase-like BadF-type ATPase
MGVTDAVLAVDAGNSKTDVCVVSLDGELLGTARGGAFRPHLVGAPAAIASIAPAVEDALSQAGSVSVRHVEACLANADLPAEQDALEVAIAATGWATSYEVVNDTFALLRAGLDCSQGVAVVCGAGINATGVLGGRIARFAAVGHISGDWGGGGSLWQEAMWWGTRGEDGRGPATALSSALPSAFGLDSMAALVEAVHLGRLSEALCMSMTPLLFAVAEAGDSVAAAVVRRQAAEVVSLAVTAIRQLGALGSHVDVVLGGGVLAARHALLNDEVTRLLALEAPLAVARVTDAPPIVGAALIGLDRVGATPEARRRLRSCFQSS